MYDILIHGLVDKVAKLCRNVVTEATGLTCAEVGTSVSSVNHASSSSDPPGTKGDENMPSTSAWDSFADRTHLHATVTRYLRFGRAPTSVGSGLAVGSVSGDARGESIPDMASERALEGGPHAASGGHMEPIAPHVTDSGVDQGLQLWADARKRASQLLDQRSAGIR